MRCHCSFEYKIGCAREVHRKRVQSQVSVPRRSALTIATCPWTQEFSSADGFLDAISSAWHKEWQRVYSTDRKDTVPFKDAGVDYQVVYTPSIKFWSVFSQGECVTLHMCPVSEHADCVHAPHAADCHVDQHVAKRCRKSTKHYARCRHTMH